MGFYFFAIKKVNAKNKLDGVSMKVGALITHFGGVLLKELAANLGTRQVDQVPKQKEAENSRKTRYQHPDF